MSIPVLFSGGSYAIPAQAERNWATILNTYLQALAANSLPRSGGSFTLAANLDLGNTATVSMKALASKTAGPSATGFIRMANNEGLGWRNAAGSADLVLKVNASDELEYAGSALTLKNSTFLGSETATIASNTITPTTTRPTQRITGAASDLQMIASPTADRVRLLINETGSDITIKNDTGGTAANRIYTGTGADFNLKNNAAAIAIYDATLSRWVLIGGGGSGGLVPLGLITTTGTSVANTIEDFDTTAGPIVRTLPVTALAVSIEYNDATGACNATNFLRITPGAGDKINGYTTSDSLVLRRKIVSVRLTKAAGSTTWYVKYQTISLLAPGFQPGYTGSAAIAAGNIGEKISGSSVAPSLTTGARSIVSQMTLTTGVWLIQACPSVEATGSISGTRVLLEISTVTNGSSVLAKGDTTAVPSTSGDISFPLNIVYEVTAASQIIYVLAYSTFSSGTFTGRVTNPRATRIA